MEGQDLVEKVQRFYDVGSPIYRAIFGEHIHDGYYVDPHESREKAQGNLIKIMAEKAGVKAGAHVLDVGCGMGGSSIWLAANLKAVTQGISISPVQLDIARKAALEMQVRCQFYLMNAQDMDFRETFDVLWVMAALTHFPDQKQFLQRAGGFLNRNGRIAIYDWAIDEKLAAVENDEDVRAVKEGMVLSNLYSSTLYQRWLVESGFRIVDAEDVTEHTIHTWNVDLAALKMASIWKIVSKFSKEEYQEILLFARARSAIKTAMQKGKVKSIIIIAEKVPEAAAS